MIVDKINLHNNDLKLLREGLSILLETSKNRLKVVIKLEEEDTQKSEEDIK